jgi:hypothetical protein
MGKQRKAIGPTRAAHDLIGVIKRIGREFAAGLNVNDNEAMAKLAQQIEPALVPRINPDRRYRIAELEVYGFKRGHFYKVYRHLIRKDGEMSYVLGRDLLALIEAAPTIADSPPRRRGRPRKSVPREPEDTMPDNQ